MSGSGFWANEKHDSSSIFQINASPLNIGMFGHSDELRAARLYSSGFGPVVLSSPCGT
jgi:hypothetical protein